MLAITSVILLSFIAGGMLLTEGHWVYTLDDAYIHLQMAKNLANSGTWGISPETFTACSSSPLWTMLLAACYSLLGAYDCIPGLINFAACLSLLFIAHNTWGTFGVEPRLRVIAGLGLLLFCPLTVIVSTGMEHTVHVLLVLRFLLAVMKGLDDTVHKGRIPSRSLISICAWGALATGVRYETCFLLIPALGLLALQRQWRCCLFLLVSASMPIVIFGLYSLAQGGFFLPNSLMLKGRIPDWHLGKLVQQLFSMYVHVSLENVHVHLLCILMLLTASFTRILKSIRTGLLILAAGCFLHLTLGACGWFYRYETYLMASGLILLGAAWLPKDILTPLLADTLKKSFCATQGWVAFSRISLLLLLVLPLLLRGIWANSRIIRASANIYEQQWQLARIFKTFEKGQARLAINDLGLMSYQFNPSVVDLWGLGSTEVTRLKYAKRYNRAAVQQLLSRQRIDYVAVFEHWFSRQDLLPTELVLVAKLRNAKNIVCLEDTVMIYARDREKAGYLKQHLSTLPFKLPSGTTIEFCF